MQIAKPRFVEATGEPKAAFDDLYQRFGSEVNRLVWRLMGADGEHEDVVQQVFEQIVRSVHTVTEPAALPYWIRGVTYNVVRSELRRRYRRRWLRLGHADPPVAHASFEPQADLRLTLEVIAKLPTDERLAFTLRFVEGLQLDEAAKTAGTSLATFKRRLARAGRRFVRLAREHPTLRERLAHSRWSHDV